MNEKSKKANRLVHEKSPYLLQHAHNPVDWYPWGDEAFSRARRENKPVFLSIGYSTCHWCHVMEKESFEDEEVARLLNAFYVAVKVDREERPDVDHIYMQAAQAMTGRGGWPLTVLMDAEGKPFFAATYLPKVDRLGMTGLLTLLDRAAGLWQNSPEELTASADRLVDVLSRSETTPTGPVPNTAATDALSAYRTSFDSEFGGFSPAPKFPTTQNLFFLMRAYAKKADPEVLEMVTTTLDAMAAGGIYDHIGFGFSRYATDDRWQVPHFEKMLYDNALLLMAYLEAFQLTRSVLYQKTAEEILTYIERDMTAPEGAFYSAEDADSEGEEGLFYTWTPAEVHQVLGPEDGARFCHHYDITEEGHLEGRSIPHRIGQDRSYDHDDFWTEARQKLLAHRSDRIRPFKDDKILTGWNGLMLAALAKGSQVLDRRDLLDRALRAWEFIRTRMIRADGRLLARYRDGEAGILAYLDDYAYLIRGLLYLFEATGDPDILESALNLNQDMLALFDSPTGALAMYGNDQEQLLLRPVQLWDGATPSGNGVVLDNLIRLSRITGRPDWDARIDDLFRALGPSLAQQPLGYAASLTAWLTASEPGTEIVVVRPSGQESEPFLAHLLKQYLPFTTAFTIEEKDPRWQTLSPFLAALSCIDQRPTAYICRNHTCSAPVTDETAFVQMMQDETGTD